MLPLLLVCLAWLLVHLAGLPEIGFDSHLMG